MKCVAGVCEVCKGVRYVWVGVYWCGCVNVCEGVWLCVCGVEGCARCARCVKCVAAGVYEVCNGV